MRLFRTCAATSSWTRPLERILGRVGFPNVLDVYSVGSLPVVRLVDGQHTALPHVGWAYRPGDPRPDVDGSVVDALVRLFGAAR
jgi:hypothetical protein